MSIVFWILGAVLVQQPASPPTAAKALDFAYFRAKVEPIFLTKRQGYTRCVVCHSGEGGAAAFLSPLSPGATAWTEEQSRRNFERVSRLVTPGQPMKSRLLLHPLEPTDGGDEFHNGGRQFKSQKDEQFLTIAAWVRGERLAGAER